jgi:Fe-Mn family superoxide dismutase
MNTTRSRPELVFAALTASAALARAADGRTWDFQADAVNGPPAGFTFGRTGHGREGKWVDALRRARREAAGVTREDVMQGQQVPERLSAFAGRHEPRPLPFDPAKLPGLSEQLLRSHWEHNYCGAVKALNAVELRLAGMLEDPDLPPYLYGDVKREELLRTGSVRLHELYFGNLGGDGQAGASMERVLSGSFGSLSRWEAEFRRTANALAGGSGWTILAYANGELHNYWAWDHTSGSPGSHPLLVLDMYEHAYHIDYGAAAARYVDAFMQNVDWETVARRLASAASDDPAGASTEGRDFTSTPG